MGAALMMGAGWASLPISLEAPPRHMRNGLGGDEREGQCASNATRRYIGSIFIRIVLSEPALGAHGLVPFCYARHIMSLPDLQGEA